MADPQINVIGSPGGGGLKLPRVSPIVIILSTVILAVIAVATAFWLYQKQQQPIAPTAPVSKPEAATTITISDNFDGASLDASLWTAVGDATGSTASLVSGQLQISIPQQSAQRFYSIRTQLITGDFSAEVELTSLTTGDSGSAEFALLGSDLQARVSRYKSPSSDRLETAFGTLGLTSINLPNGTTSVKAKIVRVGSTIQTFYDSGSGYQLLGSTSTGFTGDGSLELVSVVFAPEYPTTTSSFDNFTATVNLSGAVAPTPGTPAACTISFNVLGLSATPTPTPTTVPTPTPTSTPTPPSSPGPTPTPTPVSNPTPTPTPTPLAQAPTPTPVTLEQAGSTTGTWIVSIAGAALLILGSSLLFVL